MVIEDIKKAEFIQNIFMSETFRVYTGSDVIGVELGGALKNVIALAAGVSDGLGCGDNTKAALMTRGIAEITRLGVAMGGKPVPYNYEHHMNHRPYYKEWKDMKTTN